MTFIQTCKKAMLLPLTAGALSIMTAGAHAALTPEQLDAALNSAEEYGFTHYEEISFDDGAVDIEGWLGDAWDAEVEFTLDGNVLKEERKRGNGTAQGLSEAEVRQTIDTVGAEGMTRIEQIETHRGSFIEVEGVDANGRELEIRISRETGEVVHTDHD